MDKFTKEFQQQFSEHLLFDESVLARIDKKAKLHEETSKHPLSSSASCLNLLGSLSARPAMLIKFLGAFGLEIESLYEFRDPISVGGRIYEDQGYVIFEWIGPLKSPINETGGGRGQNRTSIDAFLLAKINGKVTQILVEWKFTEGLSRNLALGRFSGLKGVERLRRYAPILAELRRKGEFPFCFSDEYKKGEPKSALGIYDLSPDPLYQLLRMTLLAKTTLGLEVGPHKIEDYRILHLTHSQNEKVNFLHSEYLILSPGLRDFSGHDLHATWKELLAAGDMEKFYGGYWDKNISLIDDEELRTYLADRYG